MTPTSLDFSRRDDLALHAEIVGELVDVAKPLGIQPLIVGAFARDLHLFHGHGIETLRQTEDLDFALAVPDWAAFDALRSRLVATERFAASDATAHRLRHRSGLPVDLVPFGRIETSERKIAWPPHGAIVMDVFGFREAQAGASNVILPGGVQSRVVSLSALALLKIACWQDRHYVSPRKDAQDLMLILKNYLLAGNEVRLFEDFLAWTQEDEFDYEWAGARMLGHDVRTLLDDIGIERVGRLLFEQADPLNPGRLPSEMAPSDPDRPRNLLRAMLRGMMGS